MRRYLCFFFPRWPIQCLGRTLPSTIGRPLALFERTAYGPVVVVCSVEAGRLGIKAGMSLADARALVPEVLLHEADFPAYQAQLEELCLWSVQFSPLIGIENGGPHVLHPQALFLDTTGCEQVFGGEDNLLRQALSALQKKGLVARASLAPTLGAAWALAHALEIAPRPGVLSIVPSDSAALLAALEPLALPGLRLDAATLDYLYSLGLQTIGELLRQPRASLPSRFGPALIERMDQALGGAPERMTPFLPPPEFRIAWSFEYPVRSTEILFPIVEQMLAKLAAELNEARRGARQLECWLFHETAAPLRVELALHHSSADCVHLCRMLRVKMDDALRAPHSVLLKSRRARGSAARKSFSIETHERSLDVEEGVCAVALHVVSSEGLRDLQLSLFERGAEEAFSGGVALLLDSLASRMGQAAVLRVSEEDAILPEQAFRLLPLENSEQCRGRPDDRGRRGGAGESGPRNVRPLRLLPTPVKVEMNGARDFSWNGHCVSIQHMKGPERIETGWWQSRDERRDYYTVQTGSGSTLWLYQSLQDSQWFLHGTFE